MVFTMDAGGSEFSQIFLMDPAGTDDAVMLTDGESRNGAVVWDRRGRVDCLPDHPPQRRFQRCLDDGGR